MLVDVQDSIVFNEPGEDEMAVAVIGLEGVVVATTRDGILVCPKDRAQDCAVPSPSCARAAASASPDPRGKSATGRVVSRRGRRAGSSDREGRTRSSLRLRAAQVIDDQRAKMFAHVAAAVDGRDPEGVHDMRVASRRLRAALKVFAPWLDADDLDRLAPAVRTLTRGLGGVRGARRAAPPPRGARGARHATSARSRSSASMHASPGAAAARARA